MNKVKVFNIVDNIGLLINQGVNYLEMFLNGVDFRHSQVVELACQGDVTLIVAGLITRVQMSPELPRALFVSSNGGEDFVAN